jgi:hypothetical protein
LDEWAIYKTIDHEVAARLRKHGGKYAFTPNESRLTSDMIKITSQTAQQTHAQGRLKLQLDIPSVDYLGEHLTSDNAQISQKIFQDALRLSLASAGYLGSIHSPAQFALKVEMEEGFSVKHEPARELTYYLRADYVLKNLTTRETIFGKSVTTTASAWNDQERIQTRRENITQFMMALKEYDRTGIDPSRVEAESLLKEQVKRYDACLNEKVSYSREKRKLFCDRSFGEVIVREWERQDRAR